MNIKNLKLSEVHPYAGNAKKHDKKQIQLVANSIKSFGFVQPIVTDEAGVIVIGHCRFEAAKLLGMKEVPVIVAKLTEEKAKTLRLADNKSNESPWIMDLAMDDLKSLSEEMFMLTGFDLDLLIEPSDKDDIIPEKVPAKAKIGDIYELGTHRLMCGDSTQPDAVLRLMDGKKADMVFTDPPYGMNLDVSNSNNLEGKGTWKNKAKNYSKVIGDDKDYNPTHLFEMFPDVKEMFLWGKV